MPEGDHDVAEVGGDGAHRDPDVAGLAAAASASGTSSSTRLSNVPAAATAQPPRLARSGGTSSAVDCRGCGTTRAVCSVAAAHDHLRFADREHRGGVDIVSGASASTSTMRPGLLGLRRTHQAPHRGTRPDR